jgi:hypothetical protein
MASVRLPLTIANTRKNKPAEPHEWAATAGSYICLTGHRREGREINSTLGNLTCQIMAN